MFYLFLLQHLKMADQPWYIDRRNSKQRQSTKLRSEQWEHIHTSLLNKAIKMSSGKYVAILASDDYWDKTKIEK